MKAALALGDEVTKGIVELEKQAARGDIPAAMMLRDMAVRAASACHSLWEVRSEDYRSTAFDPEDSDSFKYRREMLRYWAFSRGPFPLLANNEGVPPAQIEMLEQIRHGGFKTLGAGKKGRAKDFVLSLILDEIEPAFERIQMLGATKGDLLEGRIERLPPRSFKTRKARAEMAADWVWLRRREDVKMKGSALNKIANPERQFLRDKDRGPRNQWKARAKTMKLADRYFLRGLREALLRRYSSLLAPPTRRAAK